MAIVLRLPKKRMSGTFAKVIYFERQGADRRCGVHCVNALLQGPYFSDYEFNKFGAVLDKAESALLSKQSAAFENADATGYFSIGVLEMSLNSLGKCELYRVTRQAAATIATETEAFVFNHKDHWFAVRKLLGQWWNLDSLKTCPRPVGDLEISAFVRSAIEGGTGGVFAVRGKLPWINQEGKRLGGHQRYWGVESIKSALAEEEKSGKPSTTTAASQKTDFSKLSGGVSLSSKPIGDQFNGDDHLKQAIMMSIKERQYKRLPPEPDSNVAPGDIVGVMLRTPNGRVTRKFNKSDKMIDLMNWAHAESGGLEYSVIRMGPPRTRIVEKMDGIFIEGGTADISSLSLKEAGFEGQEALTLQIGL